MTWTPAVRRACAGAVLLLLPACGGPQRPVDIGFKEVPSDVILGSHATPTPAPVPTAPGTAVAPPPPAVVALPPPTFAVGPEPPPPAPEPAVPACPSADPLQPPAREAPTSVSVSPAKASYLFHNVGSYSVSGADTRKGRFPETSLRTVSNIAHASDHFTFDVAERLGDVTTTTTYDVIVSSLVAAASPPGIYLRQVTSAQGTSRSSFAPSPELELAAFPLTRGASITSSGVDPKTATSMQFTSTVTGKARVDACGKPLDSWVIDLTQGKLISPTQNLDFASTYNLGTQYGGLMLRERTAFAGTDNGDGVSRTNTATITMSPKLP